MRSILFFDFETTSRSVKEARGLELALHRCRGPELIPVSSWVTMINPEMTIPKGAQKVNGIEQHWVDLADVESIALEEARKFIRPEDVLTGHNIKRYDMKILTRGHEYDNKVIDTMEMAKEAGFPTGHRSQPFLLSHFFPDEDFEGHRALADCQDCRRIFLEMEELIKTETQPKLF